VTYEGLKALFTEDLLFEPEIALPDRGEIKYEGYLNKQRRRSYAKPAMNPAYPHDSPIWKSRIFRGKPGKT